MAKELDIKTMRERAYRSAKGRADYLEANPDLVPARILVEAKKAVTDLEDKTQREFGISLKDTVVVKPLSARPPKIKDVKVKTK